MEQHKPLPPAKPEREPSAPSAGTEIVDLDRVRLACGGDLPSIKLMEEALWEANRSNIEIRTANFTSMPSLALSYYNGFRVGVRAVFFGLGRYVTVPANTPAADEEPTPEAKQE